MKKILTLLVMTLASWGILTAQTTPTPKFTYQAVVRHDGNLVRSQEIPTTINIYNGDALVYSETHTPTSTANGLVSILIGDGTVAEGSLTEVDWSGATLEAVFSVDDDQITSTMQVKPVPYAIQAANTELTTEQIVALVRDELTYDDVLDIVSAVAQNGTLAADLKDTVVNYLIVHKGLAKEVAEEYFSHATGDHVRQAYNALYANTPVKNKVKEILTNYLLNHPEMAKEVLTYYLTHADADDVNYAYTALTNMPADVKQAIKNRMIGYVQNHREIVYQLGLYYMTTIQGYEAAGAALYLHANNEHGVWNQLVDTLNHYIDLYMAAHPELNANAGQNGDGVTLQTVAERLAYALGQHNYVTNCETEVDLCELNNTINELVNAVHCPTIGAATASLTPNGLFFSADLTLTAGVTLTAGPDVAFRIYGTDDTYTDLNIQANLNEGQTSMYKNINPDDIDATLGLPAGTYVVKPFVRYHELCDSVGQEASFTLPPACPAISADSTTHTLADGVASFTTTFNSSDLDATSPRYVITDNSVSPAATQTVGASFANDRQSFSVAEADLSNYAGKTLTVTPMVDVRCGYDNPDSYTEIEGGSFELEIPFSCPEFTNVSGNISDNGFQMVAAVDLSEFDAALYKNPKFVVTVDGVSTDYEAIYDVQTNTVYSSTYEVETEGWAGKTITFRPVVEVKCGDNAGFTPIQGATTTQVFTLCPALGQITLASNNAADPAQRLDTLYAEFFNYNDTLVDGVTLTLTSDNQNYGFTASWNEDHSFCYHVFNTSALRDTLNIQDDSKTFTAEAQLSLTQVASACHAATATGQVTFAAFPACPTLDDGSAELTSDGITVRTEIADYNTALLSVNDNGTFYYTYRIGTSDVNDHVLAANYANGYMVASIPAADLQHGTTYSFTPHMVVGGFCTETGDDEVITADSVTLEVPVACPTFGPTEVTLEDNSITFQCALAGYTADAALTDVRFTLNTENGEFPTVDATVGDGGVMEAEISLDADPYSGLHGLTVSATPSFTCQNETLSGSVSEGVCVPYPDNSKPSFTAVSNTSGLEKQTLFKNEGVVLTAKIADYDNFANNIHRKGYLLSLESITDYSTDLAVAGEMTGTTGDTLTYTVRIDSCGKTVYYRPFVILYGCDSVVLGEEKSFEMWAPDFTVGADPNPASSGEQVTLTAVATMTIGTWTDNYSFIQSGYGSLHENFCPGANLPALPDATSTKPLETWVNFLNTIDEVCSAVSNIIQSAIGMAPGEVSHEYRWSTESGEFSTSAADGAVTVYPTATTTYIAISDFSYSGEHCVLKKNVTVTVQ